MSVLRRCIFNEKEKKWITQIFFMEKNGQFAVIVLQMEIFPLEVRMSGKNAIEWPKLDVDLEIDSLKHPERYPLIMKRNELEVL